MKKRIIVTSWIIVMSLILPCIVFAGSVLLTWKAGPEPDIAGYWVYYGTSARVYGPPIPVGNVTSYTVSGLDEGQTYYFSITAVDTSGNESGYSVERAVTISDTIAPTVAITSPTTAGTYDTADALITISGNASDNVGVSEITWANSAGGSGTATGTATWSISDISLFEGENIVTVTATDAAGNQTSASLTVTYTPPDTIAPTVAITSPTTAGTYDTAAALITISGNASDNVGVSQVTWFSSGSGSGTAIGTETWSISNIELVEGSNIITIWAKDAAGNENSAALKVTYTPPTPVISDLIVASGTTYEVVDGLDNGSKAYVDSDSTYSYLPDVLKNATYIKTSINDRTSTTNPFISFTVNKDVNVCLAHDDRIDPKPSWLPFKNKTAAKLAVGNKAMSIYTRVYHAGKTVKLGGNEGDINSNMYTIIIVER